jgi:hypothetical protein
MLAAAITGGFEIVLCDSMLEEIGTAMRYRKVRKRILRGRRSWREAD